MHSSFFSSLERVEKRLKLDRHDGRRRRPPPQTAAAAAASSSLDHSPISPLYLLSSQPHHRHRQALDPPPPPLQDSSEAPEAFLSCSPQFRPPPESPPPPPPPPAPGTDADSADDIDRLMRMLGLGNREPKPRGEGAGCRGGGAGACECAGGFYERVAGVKGPKCRKEAERLDGWIEYFSNGGSGSGDEDERAEPLRLVHLLLGKAASACEGGGACGSGGLVFPSTVDEFLRNDPPGPDD